MAAIARKAAQCAKCSSSRRKTQTLSAAAPIPSTISGGAGRLRKSSAPTAYAVHKVNAAPASVQRSETSIGQSLQQHGIDLLLFVDGTGYRGCGDGRAQELQQRRLGA